MLSILPLSSFAQATKKVKVKFQNPWYQEEYTVLKSNPKVRQGLYRKYVGMKQVTLVTEGYYTKGQKDSLWIERNLGAQGGARGHYRQDQKMGVWEYYAKGEIEQRYDYTQQKLLFQKPMEAAATILFKPLATTTAFETAPVYIGGYATLSAFVGQNVKFPFAALRNNESGTVRIVFTIASDGAVSNYRVVKSVTPGLDEEALRVVKLMPTTWIPAQAAGQPVAAECEVPVTYRIF